MKVYLNFNFNKNTDLEAVIRKLEKIERSEPGVNIEVNVHEDRSFSESSSNIEEALKIELREESQE